MKKLPLIALFLGLISFVQAGVISTTGVDFLSIPPTDVGEGGDVGTPRLFLENSLTLSSSLTLEIFGDGVYGPGLTSPTPTTLASGTAINSYYFDWDPASSVPITAVGSFSFSESVLGVIYTNTNQGNGMNNANSILGLSTISYGVQGTELQGSNDSITLLGSTVSFSLQTNGSGIDVFRVITAAPSSSVPDGANTLILLGGVFGLFSWILRRRDG